MEMYRILNFILEPKKLCPYSEVGGGVILERTYSEQFKYKQISQTWDG